MNTRVAANPRQTRNNRRAMARMLGTSLLSALCGVMLTWAVMGHQPAAATVPVEASAAWAVGNWGDTTVPAASFAASDSAESIAPTF